MESGWAAVAEMQWSMEGAHLPSDTPHVRYTWPEQMGTIPQVTRSAGMALHSPKNSWRCSWPPHLPCKPQAAFQYMFQEAN